jgi:hypothetical protein
MQNINKILGDSAFSFKKLLPQNIIDSLNQISLYKILRKKRLTVEKVYRKLHRTTGALMRPSITKIRGIL